MADPILHDDVTMGKPRPTTRAPELELAGGDSSGNEVALAEKTAKLLEQLVHLSRDDAEASQHLHDLGQLLLHPLDDPQRALASFRTAQQKHATIHTARGHRKAALRAGSKEDVLVALEAEARLSTGAQKASLEVARGGLLADNPAAARQAYEAALVAGPADLSALWGLVELDLADGQLATASERVQKIGEAIGDAAAKADLLAWAARLAERAGRLDLARATLVQAELHGQSSPAVRFLAERLHADTAPRALITLLEAQIADGTLAPAAGWLEVGALARYLVDDPAGAKRAFTQALAAVPKDDPAHTTVLGELAELNHAEGSHTDALWLEEQRLAAEVDPVERALAWTRIGTWREESLDDSKGAAEAYGKAVELAPGFTTALEGAGRTYAKLGDSDRLLAVHLAEAEQTAAPSEKATALRRAGELLVSNSDRAEVGVGYLDAASRLAPQHAGIFLSLERALRRRKDFAALADLYERELGHTQSPRRRAALHLQIGQLSADQLNDTKRAIAAFRAAAAIPGGAPDQALSSLARILDESDELTELEPVLAELTTLTDDPVQIASLYERAGQLREQRGDVSGAVETYLKALENAPPSHSIHGAAGRAFARAGRWDALISAYEKSSQEGPPTQRASNGYRLGFVLARRLGRVDDGIAQLERVRAESPEHLPTLALLATLYTEQRRWATLRTILAAMPQTAARRVRRALLAEGLGHTDEALQLWSDLGGPLASRARERLYARLGRWSELADAYETHDSPVARYRAAELRLERTSAPDLARTLLEGQERTTPIALTLLRAIPAQDAARAPILTALVDSVEDAALRTLLQSALVTLPLPDDEQVAALQKLLTLSPRDPVVLVALEAKLEAQRARPALVTLLRTVQRDGKQDDHVVAAASCRLGLLLEELGSAREAIDAYEMAASSSTLLALVALVRLYRSIGDVAKYHGALQALATAMPSGDERVPVLRRLAADQLATGDRDGAIATLEWVLRDAPRAYDALRELDALVGDTMPERVADALLRALPLEPPGAQRLDVGMALASRQLALGRIDPAKETLDRVLADDPQHLRAHLLAAELETQAERWAAVGHALSAIVEHKDVSAEMKREALGKLARVQVEHLGDVAAAQKTAQQLDGKDLETLELQLTIASRSGDHAALAARLEQLIAHESIDDERRADAQIRLAGVQEHDLGDVTKAIATLGEVRLPGKRKDAVDRLLELGGKSDRWDLAASALEATLDRGGDMDPAWEIAIRRRLASLLEGPAQREDAAARQYERIVALDPGDVPTLERLASLSGSAPEKAIDWHRALVAADPKRLESWRALRTLFIQTKDEDGAFLVEALLEATKLADEEESYFYKQRRSKLKSPAEGELSAEERGLLAPEAAQPAFALLHLLAPVIDKIFPIDWAAYGSDGNPPSYTGPLVSAAQKTSRLFAVPAYQLVAVPNRVGPCVEAPFFLFVPRGTEEAPPREQAAVLGELFARLSFDALVGDSRRATPLSSSMIDYLLAATCEAVTDFVSPHRGRPVYEDIKRRVVEAIASVDSAALEQLARRVSEATPTAEQLVDAMDRVTARASLFCAQDPFLAITAALDRAPAQGERALPSVFQSVLPFLVSAGHLALRRRLQMGVSA